MLVQYQPGYFWLKGVIRGNLRQTLIIREKLLYQENINEEAELKIYDAYRTFSTFTYFPHFVQFAICPQTNGLDNGGIIENDPTVHSFKYCLATFVSKHPRSL